MEKGDTPPLLVPLLALLAIIFPLSMSFRTSGSSSEKTSAVRQPAPQPPTKEPEKAIAKLPRHSAAEVVHDYLLPRSEEEREWPESDPRNHYSLDFVIATVPDPADSRLAYYFDAAIDSIQRALEASGYLLDRFDLPWPETLEAGVGSGTESAARRYRRDPGIMLFRNPGQLKLLLVFLVGETPTRGLQKSAMAGAFDQMSAFFPASPEACTLPKELCRLTETKQKDSPLAIKIMGPTFSGSAVSLDFAVRDWRSRGHGRLAEPGTVIRIVSGSATAINPDNFVPFASFRAVVPPDILTMKEIFAYIRNLGYSRIAMLTEASTSYGSAATPRPVGKDKPRNDQSGSQDASQPMILYLPFPLHISQLRTASEKQRLSQPKSTSGAINNPSPSIPLEEGESSQPRETPPSFSPLEAPSAELVLSNLLSTVSREGIHAVGILATDVRDTIYLVREIREHCPGTLVFTVNADLLYGHGDVNTSTRGMLVFTPYPLFNSNQVWTSPHLGRPTFEHPGLRLQFSSQHAEGVYNAMLALLDHQEEMLDYGKPFQPQGSGTSAGPALWVTVVGQNGPLPVKLLDWTRWNSSEDHPNYANYALTFERQSQKQPTIDETGIYTSWSVIGIMLLSCLVIAISLLIIHQYHSPESATDPSRSALASSLLGEPVTPAYRSSARLFLLAWLACLLSAFMVLTVTYSLPLVAAWRVGSIPGATHRVWLTGLLLAEVLMSAGWVTLAIAMALVLRAFRKNHSTCSVLPRAVKWVVLVGCSGVLGLALLLCVVWLGWKDPPEQIATFLRGFEYFSGMSPLVPLFCLAFAGVLWGFCSFRRLRMIDGIRPIIREITNGECLLSLDTPSFLGVESLERKVRERLEEATAFSTGRYIGMSIVGLLVVGYLFFPFVPSHEGRWFYYLYGLGFFLVYFAFTGELGRLCLVWGAFRRLLQRLALHPTRSAYGRYRKSFKGLPRIDLAMPLQAFAVLSFSLDQAERLLRLGSSLVSSTSLPEADRRNLENWIREARPAVQTAADNLSQALEWKAKGNWSFAIKGRSLSQQALGKLTQLTAEYLEPSWHSKNLQPSLEASPELKQFQKLGEECLVGRTVLLISYVLPSLREMGAFIISGLLLMLCSVMFYPFVQSNHFLAFNWIVILSFIGLTLLVTLQMERDVLLGLLNENSKPGQVSVTRHLTFRVLTYVMIPILALLSAQFPDTVGRIVSLFSAAQSQ